MNKIQILTKYKNPEEKLLVSKLLDKINVVENKNKIQYTDFLSPVELKILIKVLNMMEYKNYIVYGVIEEAQRNIILLYPKNLEFTIKNNYFNYNDILNCIRISDNDEQYEHKVYLSGLMKLGVKREKVGDIIVFDKGADIIVDKDITKFLLMNLNSLTRFKKSKIELIKLEDITIKVQEFSEMKITVSSVRIDNVVSKLCKGSRAIANKLIEEERVFINYEKVGKVTKVVNKNDLITIRGIGKFIVDDIMENSKKNKFVIGIRKFI